MPARDRSPTISPGLWKEHAPARAEDAQLQMTWRSRTEGAPPEPTYSARFEAERCLDCCWWGGFKVGTGGSSEGGAVFRRTVAFGGVSKTAAVGRLLLGAAIVLGGAQSPTTSRYRLDVIVVEFRLGNSYLSCHKQVDGL